uniref:ADP-ribosylglycohydrolase n=1 Tax=Ditylenchus dipsaci TaxID=166011 RepID=A0A915EDD1_9BILA
MEISNVEMKRIRGVFYGQAVGDALGSRYEFCSEQVVKSQIAEDKENSPDGLLPMLGTNELRPGQITDDTEMALCLARSLVAKNEFDPVDIACSYLQWMQFKPIDSGIATRKALVIEG